MSPITFKEAYDQTNPSNTEEQRNQAAINIMAGVAANDSYWNSRSELEALKAQAAGHGAVAIDLSGEAGPTVGAGTGATPIEGSATEEAAPSDASTDTTEAPATAAASAPPASIAPPSTPPSPDNPTEAVAKLRAQLTAAGINPDA